MSFFSAAYLLFMLTLLGTYYAVGRLFKRGQWVVILVFSLVFYTLMGGVDTLWYVCASAGISFVAARIFFSIDKHTKAHVKTLRSREEKKAYKKHRAGVRRLVLWGSIFLLVAVLCYLKYWNTFAWYLSLEPNPRSLGLMLPLGISFYTFQALSYLIDVYNEKYEPTSNFLKYFCYITYFPQIIQGPINRFDAMKDELFGYHNASDTHFAQASLLFLYGMMKKFVMADLLVEVIARVLDNDPTQFAGSIIAFAILLYSIQQYGDFSGGIDMVEATSEMLGIHMQPNFRQPYFSVSLADFWRRWHISLGLWMKDYIFYPLALTRPMKNLGKFLTKHSTTHIGRTVPAGIANICVFLLVGIWHGPEIHFLFWGLYNGAVIALSDFSRPWREHLLEKLSINTKSVIYHAWCVLQTFIIVNIGWYFDRIYDPSASFAALFHTVTHFNAHSFPSQFMDVAVNKLSMVGLSMIACVIVIVVSVCEERGIPVKAYITSKPVWVRYIIYLVGGFLVLLGSAMSTTHGGFMYANY